jgi:hypothetical protein
MVAPAVAVADAVNVVAVPTVAPELFAGDVIATDVAVTAVTAATAEVAVAPVESTTLAVMFCKPADAGTHVTEYGAVVSTPMSVEPA